MPLIYASPRGFNFKVLSVRSCHKEVSTEHNVMGRNYYEKHSSKILSKSNGVSRFDTFASLDTLYSIYPGPTGILKIDFERIEVTFFHSSS